MYDWNDLRHFLAVARGGSTLAAARALAVNQTTVARRIEALEHRLGLKLFERGQAGSRLTEAGASLVAEAERVERMAVAFESQAQAFRRGMAGSIRVTLNDAMANALTPGLGEFRALYPGIMIELDVCDEVLDLASGAADVAVRTSKGVLEDSDLIARKIGIVTWSIYCSRGYAERRGYPRTPEEMNDHALIAGDGILARVQAMAWMMENAPAAEIAARSNTVTNLNLAVKAGLGIAPLPCLTADMDEDLVQCFPPLRDLSSTTWIITRPDLKDVPRIRAFVDFMVPHFSRVSHAMLDKARAVRGGAPLV